MQTETIKAGKTRITRTPFGVVSFVDTRGIKRTFYGEPDVLRLVDAIKDGSGKATETVKTEGTAPIPPSGPQWDRYVKPRG